MMFVVLGAIVLLVFMLGVAGVVTFLNQDYQAAAQHSATTRKTVILQANSDSLGCCKEASLACMACRQHVSSKLLCLRRPNGFPECPDIQGTTLGNGEIIRALESKILDAPKVTVSTWVRTSVGGTVLGNRVSSCSNSEEATRVAQYGYLLKITEHGRLSLTVGTKDRGCLSLTSATGTVPFDQWAHIGFLISDGESPEAGLTISLFANGVEVASLRGGAERPLPRFRSAVNVFTVGAASDGTEPFVGIVADVQVYHGSLRSALAWVSPDEPRDIDSVPELISSFLLLHYSFKSATDLLLENDIVDITDLSGTGRHAVLMSGRYVRTEEIFKKDREAFLSWLGGPVEESNQMGQPEFVDDNVRTDTVTEEKEQEESDQDDQEQQKSDSDAPSASLLRGTPEVVEPNTNPEVVEPETDDLEHETDAVDKPSSEAKASDEANGEITKDNAEESVLAEEAKDTEELPDGSKPGDEESLEEQEKEVIDEDDADLSVKPSKRKKFFVGKKKRRSGENHKKI